MSDLTDITSQKLPKHVAIIMDGNGRWAKQQGKPRVFGHKNGVKSVQEIVEAAAEIGINTLTLYTFSTENWNRPKQEVDVLMGLLVRSLKKELKTLIKNNIKLQTIGKIDQLPEKVVAELKEVIEKTKNNTRLTLNLALNYGAREEIVNAIKIISKKVVNNELSIAEIDENIINNHLYTVTLPDVDFLIRTSGEKRISNFLLWQIAYAEFYFTDVLWPDFRKEHFFQAIKEYQQRERRFGKTSEQIKTSND
ncbi:MAG: di-trans,poly-cis-decaprenylcistransferase [Flavobacteriales bacterium CG03_land_8_20_14_0_80_35_15]|nr:MAG: di-trans,poly-cis-decaprenylcistransferase [Flavobacteriaceae bacterium CG1_02_35_72]PIR14598.1 MAG: di-trans,poly-cis-decaprenylcistransferase [Flavobacteriales bacterium CG11_big_fil_rev_8_21_14_0_20_35_7]PIV17593.1 MAG: di-trans,poly-cis-decaprenylcistransferase [Flavobacteriales bacterium CG03_land_8_20_14_0_80_35_15]PIX06202.1 MAG: di-trans,poly-cis-decaprenylcistransferase [Flavobacteriales bacterium CG_4_8_14_3_um_filter_35_10]PJA06292.1 MAG: di-trans,poly-cis-decaprenylcistransf